MFFEYPALLWLEILPLLLILHYVYLELDPDTGISDLSDALAREGLEVKEVRFHHTGAHCDKMILGLKNHMGYPQDKILEIIQGENGVKFFKILP